MAMWPISMFLVLLLFIMTGFPVAFCLSGTAILFALLGYISGVFYITDLGFVPTRIFGVMNNLTLVAVPLFVFMGVVLDKSDIAKDLLISLERIFRRVRGGLAIAVVLVAAVLAASTGIVGATVVTLGILALPTMLERGCSKELAAGVVAASGTLGQIIPPSIVLVLLGDLMNVDVGDLFVGSIIPGLLLVGAYLVYVYFKSGRTEGAGRESSEDLAEDGQQTNESKSLLKSLLPPLGLMTLVLGTILFGVASPTEAAACGAAGALVIAAAKKKFSLELLKDVTGQTTQITSMVFLLLIGAQFFGVVFRGFHGEDLFVQFIQSAGISETSAVLGIMLVVFVLGFFLDFLEICFIVIPILLPIIRHLGVDPLWFSVLLAVNLQTSFLTPPFGFALFYLKGVAPPEVSTKDIYRGVAPFVAIQIVILGLLFGIPELATWLPKLVF